MPMKVKDLIALLEADGWFLVRTEAVTISFTTPQNAVPSPCRASRVSGFRQVR